MLLLVRLSGSKAIIHNSPFLNPVASLCTTKETENMEYNLMDYHFSWALWHNDTITLKLNFKAGKRGWSDRKISRIIFSLVFNFDKLTGSRRNHFLVLSVKLQRVGRALYIVATGHCCPTDELSDNNWVKRGKQMMSRVHEVERVDWFIFQNNTCQSKSVLLRGVGGWGESNCSFGSLSFTAVPWRVTVCTEDSLHNKTISHVYLWLDLRLKCQRGGGSLNVVYISKSTITTIKKY